MESEEIRKIIHLVDHTLLTQTATWEEIKQLCDDAITYNAASVCIPPSFVQDVKAYVKQQIPICTVIGFPNGYQTKEVKIFETKDALSNGADEIDMVINLGDVKDKKFEKIEQEIYMIKKVCGSKILKVIIETCLLTKQEKIMLCKIVTRAKADFIKTSTGFSIKGATKEDISLFRQQIGKEVKIKAAGGITSFLEAKELIDLGAVRLGTSRLIKLLKDENTV